MRLNSIILVSSVAAFVSEASAFEWTPAIQQPNLSVEVTQSYALETLIFNCQGVKDVAMGDLMPYWIDEDGNEITAVSGVQNPWGWDPQEFNYSFNLSDFKSNGEYILRFPEGMLVNGDGDKSSVIDSYYTVDIPELAPAMFDDFQVLSVSPDFSEPQGLWSSQVVTINTNHNDAIGYTSLQIFDKTTGESIVFSTNFTKNRVLGSSSEISWTVEGSYKFYEGHEYSADFIFYNGRDAWTENGATPVVDRISYKFEGKIEPYKYSDITLLSVTPTPGVATISSRDQAIFTYNFSGPVDVYRALTPLGQNGNNVYPQSCLSSNEDKTIWTLNLSNDSYANSVDASLTIAIYVRDSDGYQLQGNFGEESESCFLYDWECDLGGKPIIISSPASGENLDRLTQIIVKSESGQTMTWSWTGNAYVSNDLGEIVGTLVYEEPAGNQDAALAEFCFTKWKDASNNVASIDLDTKGSYSIYFSPGCFVFGSQYSSTSSSSVTSSFYIKSEAGEDPENPENPDNPDNPENPDTPDNPDDPENPDNPDNPDNPENPDNPDNPDDPEDPDNPDEPDPEAPMFKDFEILSVDPDFSQPQNLWDDQLVKINTNHNDAIGYTELQIFEVATGEGVVLSNNYSTGRTLGNSSEISWTVANTYKFYKDHEYSAEFVFYNGSNDCDQNGVPTPIVAKASYSFMGMLEASKYSSETLQNITPEPGSAITEASQAVFTYTFSGPVNVFKAETPMGQFGTTVYPDSCLSSNEDKTVWTLNLSDNEYVKSVDAELVIYIYARDIDGYQLQGDFGEGDDSCFSTSWLCDLGAKPIAVVSPENDSTIDCLNEVVVKSVDGEAMTYNSGEAYITNSLGEILGYLVYERPEEADSDSATEFYFKKWIVGESSSAQPIEIVAAGAYEIYFSTGCFVFGEEFSSKNSRSFKSTFNITGNADDTPVVDPAQQETFNYDRVSPDDGSTVVELNHISLWFPDVVVTLDDTVCVYKVDAIDDAPVTNASINWDFEDECLINIDLINPISEAGEYVVVIPARIICDNPFFGSQGKEGICNPEIRLTYTVDPEGSFAVDYVLSVVGSDVFDINGHLVLRNASAAEIKTLSKGIYLVGNKKFVIR